MEKSKLIIVEGPQGAGKTTVTDFIRFSLSYTNLYRLGGTSDKTIDGKEKSKKMYYALLDYIKTLEDASINLLFDRTFFSEEVYCRLGYKDYSFSDVYDDLLKILCSLNFDIYFIALYLSDENEFEKRLFREAKADIKYAKFNKENSVNQQNAYLKIADEISEKYPNVNVVKFDNCISQDDMKVKIKEILN